MREGSAYSRVLDDGREIAVHVQIYNARLVISRSPESPMYFDGW